MTPSYVPLIIFALCYALFVMLPTRRALTACLGAVALIITGPLTWHEALTEAIQWNVVALFFGTLVLAELFMMSRMPAVMAEHLVARTKTVRAAMLAVCALSSFLSIFVENVAVVLLIAPVALSLAKKLNLSPVRLLIGVAVCSNLQGTATLIGDPPSMILAGYMKMNFNDFFMYHGKPGIFFAVQAGGIASLAVLAWLLRGHRGITDMAYEEHARSWVPTCFLVALVIGLASASSVDPDFKWFAGTFTMALAVASLIWFRLGPRWTGTRALIKTLDWDTTFFLVGVFVLVGGLSDSGWLEKLGIAIGHHVGSNLLYAFVVITLVAVLVSAFVDNVPFLLAMIPVVQQVADGLGVPVPLLMFALLIGSCLGGNITPIGASANVVTIGILKKQGYVVSFREFMAVGIPFTAAAVTAASLFVWWIWAP